MGIRPYEGIAVVGPTACGKTRRAVEIARHFGGEIISGDSRQVYRDMSIGTGKDLEEYGNVPYHLIDICEAGEKYNLHKYLKAFSDALSDIQWRGRLPVFCGGSGMYVENALDGIVMPEVPANPELRRSLAAMSLEELTCRLAEMKALHNTTDVDTCQRAVRAIEIAEYYRNHPAEAEAAEKSKATPRKFLIIGLDIPRDDRRRRISERLRQRVDDGMIEEVKSLLDRGLSSNDLIYYGLEYKYVTLHLLGRLSREEMISQLETAIHQFAKRQMTWFRGMERRGHTIHWLPWDMKEEEFITTVSDLM